MINDDQIIMLVMIMTVNSSNSNSDIIIILIFKAELKFFIVVQENMYIRITFRTIINIFVQVIF